MSTGRALRALVRNYPGLFAFDVVLQLLRSTIPLLPGIVVARILDSLVRAPGLSPNMLLLFAVLVGLALARVTALLSCVAVDARVTSRTSSLLMRNAFDAILTKPGAEPLSRSTGDVLSRLGADTEAVSNLLTFTLMVIGSGVQALLAVGIMLSIDAEITLVVFGPLAATGVLINLASQRIKHLHQRNRQADGEVSAFLGEVFGSIQAVQLGGAQQRVLDRFQWLNDTRRGQTLQSKLFTDVFLRSVWGNAANVAIGIVLLLAAAGVEGGTFSVGALALFVAYLGWISDFTALFSQNFALYRQAGIAVGRLAEITPGERGVSELVVEEPRIVPADNRSPIEPLACLEVEGLTFAHPGGNGIHGIDLTVRAGSLVVVTGQVGAGKTTLLRTLTGLLPKQSGTIRWNGTEVTDPAAFFVPPRSAYVPQVPRLFSDSIEENIRMGLRIDHERVREAVRSAVLERDLDSLIDGLQTEIGPRGMRLSGGQIQRVAAARMFVRAPDLLIFDDISSALDTDTERELWDRLMQQPGRTCLVVSHRQAVLDRADHVIVMRGGRVQTPGSHAGVPGSGPGLRARRSSATEECPR
ncbi:ABC transporter ATP-binding protein [Nocardia spumae]|uniref:ABC transporter ATP-binding protein n=1 Tax=Nocardia spumae TaxID=2887190 RepID=UPI001D14AF76|nr:ABC transporter ATP-binding protein [Nocardia spumae]